MTRLLCDPDPMIRELSADILGRVGDTRAIQSLVKAASIEREYTVRRALVSNIGKFGSNAKLAIPLLVKIIKDHESYPLDMVSNCDEGALATDCIGCAAVLAISRIGTTALPQLLAIYSDSTIKVGSRKAAASAIRRLGKDAISASPKIREMFSDCNVEIRIAAISTLIAIDPLSPETKRSLYSSLADSSPFVTIVAAVELFAIDPNNPVSVPVLARLLSDMNPDVQWRTAVELGRMGRVATMAVPDLIALLDTSDANVRLEVISTLGAIGPSAKSAIPTLKRLENNEDRTIRLAIQKAMRKILTSN